MKYVVYQTHVRKTPDSEWELLSLVVSPIGEYARDIMDCGVLDMDMRTLRVRSAGEFVKLTGLEPVRCTHPDWDGELVEIGDELMNVTEFFT